MRNLEELRKLVNYLVNNFEKVEWKKAETSYMLYWYETTVNGLKIEVKGFYDATLSDVHYVGISVYGSSGMTLKAFSGRNTDNINELLLLEEKLGEGETWKEKEDELLNKIKTITD